VHRRRDANLTRISKIVAAIDLSECSKSVAERACVLASAFISDVYLVSVIKIANLVGQEGDINMQEIQEEEAELSNHHKMLIDKLLQRFQFANKIKDTTWRAFFQNM